MCCRLKKERKKEKVKSNESLEALYHSGASSFKIADNLSCISKLTLARQKCSPETPAQAFNAAVLEGRVLGGRKQELKSSVGRLISYLWPAGHRWE